MTHCGWALAIDRQKPEHHVGQMVHIGFGVESLNRGTIPKKPYARPALTKWGKLIDLTRTDWAPLEGDLRMGTLNINILEGRRLTGNRLPSDW